MGARDRHAARKLGSIPAPGNLTSRTPRTPGPRRGMVRVHLDSGLVARPARAHAGGTETASTALAKFGFFISHTPWIEQRTVRLIPPRNHGTHKLSRIPTLMRSHEPTAPRRPSAGARSGWEVGIFPGLASKPRECREPTPSRTPSRGPRAAGKERLFPDGVSGGGS